MLIKDVRKCEEIIAGDNSILRELLNPLKEDLTIRYSLAHTRVKPGQTTLAHRLKSAEVYCILEGTGEMYVDNQREEVMAGQAIYIPPQSVQRIRNDGQDDLVFLCIVDPPWRPEDEEVVGGGDLQMGTNP
jgi:mannose-6-phosphate isomerase-like protein (cupin superfamily)